MAELSPTFVAELDRLSPDEPTHPNWLDVRRRARPRRRTHTLLAAAALVAVAIPSVAFSSGVRSLLGFSPQPVVAKSRVLVSAPVGNGFWAHYMTGPSDRHGWCVFTIVDHSAAVEKSEKMNGGGGCSLRGRMELLPDRAHPMSVGVSIVRRPKHGVPASWVPPVVTGTVARALRAARVEIVWSGGAHRLALHGTHFVGGTPDLYLPKASAFPFTVTAYDAKGAVVATKKLDRKVLELR